MGILQRSKSEGVTVPKVGKRKPKAAEATGGEEKRSTSFERPSTSFSRPLTANAAIGRSFDLPHPSFMIDFKSGDEVFSFPMPSPRVPLPKIATIKRTPSPLVEPGVPDIGVAIGSPTHAKPSWGHSATVDNTLPRLPIHPPPARSPPGIPEHPDLEMPLGDLRKKKASWKSLGGLFGLAPAKMKGDEPLKLTLRRDDTERPILQLREPDLQKPVDLPELVPPPLFSMPSHPRGRARFEARAEASKASSPPVGQPLRLRSPSMIQKEGLSPMFRCINGIPEDKEWIDDLRKDSPLSLMSAHSFRAGVETIDVSGTPQLELNLPDPRFERYSIMFEKQLDVVRPSLLERRQSKLNRNQPVKKLDLTCNARPQNPPRVELNGVPQRSATSPHLGRLLSTRIGKKLLSPVTEVFTALNRPHPVRRSKTAPTLPISPLAKGFASPTVAVEGCSPGSAVTSDFSLPPTPMTFTTISDCGSVEVIGNDLPGLRSDIENSEPSWNMMTSEPIEDRRAPYLRVKPATGLSKHVVQVSVARQVTVNETINQMRTSVESNFSMRPKVVELGKNRTSTFVVIEGVAA